MAVASRKEEDTSTPVPAERPAFTDPSPTSPSAAPAKIDETATVRSEQPVRVVDAPTPPVTADLPNKTEPLKAQPAKGDPVKSEPPPAKAEPAKVEPAKAEPAKAEPAKAEPAKAEPAEAQVRTDAPKAVEQVVKAKPADEPRPVEEAKAKPADAVKTKPADDVKKGAASKNDASTKKPEPARANDKGARKPEPARKEKEEDVDASSISAEFFRKDQDSVPPVEEHDEVEHLPRVALSPEAVARRARLRRLVAGVVAFAGVLSIAVVGKALAGKHQAPMPPLAAEMKRELPAAPDPKPSAGEHAAAAPKPAADVSSAAPAPAPAATAEAKPDEAKKEDVKVDGKADDAKKDEAKIDAKPDDAKKDDKPAASAADVKALKKETESLLNRGRNKDAIEKAKELIAADPTDASGYLFLGAALQETGKWKDGIASYSDCVRNATKGPINECRAMGGHK